MPGSTTTPSHPCACGGALGHVAFRALDSVGTRDINSVVAHGWAYTYPCQRFAPHLAVRHA